MPGKRMSGLTIPRAVFANFFRLNLLIILVVLFTALGVKYFLRPKAVPASTGGLERFTKIGGGEIFGLWEMDISMARSLLHQGIPLLKVRNNPQTLYQRPRGFFRVFTDLVLEVDMVYPLTLLKKGFAQVRFAGDDRQQSSQENGPVTPRIEVSIRERKKWEERPLVAIYHTHTSESYLSTTGKKWAEGEAGDVTRVGEELAKTLWQEFGVAVVHNRTIHDWPTWRLAYVNALQTVEELVKTYPELQIVLDIHRDATEDGDPIDCLTSFAGEKTARVLIIVGSDNLGLPHPRWRENLEFAHRLHAKMEELYPGLSRGVRFREDGRWNQHLHPHAVILEIGEVHNTEEEAKAAARRMAHVLFELLKELKAEDASAGSRR